VRPSGERTEELKSDRAASPCGLVESSPSFVGAPEGNGVAERFMRTLKERPASTSQQK
jgi:hypothetical protein